MGANVWNWFNEEARTNTAGYWWCPKKGVKAVGDDDEDSWGDSLESDDDAGYWSSTSGASGVSRASSATDRIFLEPFDIKAGAGKNKYDLTINPLVRGAPSLRGMTPRALALRRYPGLPRTPRHLSIRPPRVL